MIFFFKQDAVVLSSGTTLYKGIFERMTIQTMKL